VAGDCRPPAASEVPDVRYLAYGTSITEGAKATATHLNYVSRVAQRRGYDALNLGCSGSAYCEGVLAEYIARRNDWDVATFALSVNMANAAFSTAQCRERVEGTDLLSPGDLTWDVLHPGDEGMQTIGAGLARHLDSVTG
jgi:lysophospholipase L1-like esterase